MRLPSSLIIAGEIHLNNKSNSNKLVFFIHKFVMMDFSTHGLMHCRDKIKMINEHSIGRYLKPLNNYWCVKYVQVSLPRNNNIINFSSFLP